MKIKKVLEKEKYSHLVVQTNITSLIQDSKEYYNIIRKHNLQMLVM
jgi:hypothetical protein